MINISKKYLNINIKFKIKMLDFLYPDYFVGKPYTFTIAFHVVVILIMMIIINISGILPIGSIELLIILFMAIVPLELFSIGIPALVYNKVIMKNYQHDSKLKLL